MKLTWQILLSTISTSVATGCRLPFRYVLTQKQKGANRFTSLHLWLHFTPALDNTNTTQVMSGAWNWEASNFTAFAIILAWWSIWGLIIATRVLKPYFMVHTGELSKKCITSSHLLAPWIRRALPLFRRNCLLFGILIKIYNALRGKQKSAVQSVIYMRVHIFFISAHNGLNCPECDH